MLEVSAALAAPGLSLLLLSPLPWLWNNVLIFSEDHLYVAGRG